MLRKGKTNFDADIPAKNPSKPAVKLAAITSVKMIWRMCEFL